MRERGSREALGRRCAFTANIDRLEIAARRRLRRRAHHDIARRPHRRRPRPRLDGPVSAGRAPTDTARRAAVPREARGAGLTRMKRTNGWARTLQLAWRAADLDDDGLLSLRDFAHVVRATGNALNEAETFQLFSSWTGKQGNAALPPPSRSTSSTPTWPRASRVQGPAVGHDTAGGGPARSDSRQRTSIEGGVFGDWNYATECVPAPSPQRVPRHAGGRRPPAKAAGQTSRATRRALRAASSRRRRPSSRARARRRAPTRRLSRAASSAPGRRSRRLATRPKATPLRCAAASSRRAAGRVPLSMAATWSRKRTVGL